MSDRKPAFKKPERQHPAAPTATAEPPAAAAAARAEPAAPASPPAAAAPRARAASSAPRGKNRDENYVQLNALVPKELRQRLRVLVATDDSLKVHDHVARALEQYLDGLTG